MLAGQEIKKLQTERKIDELFVYFTSDRQPANLFSTQIAQDIIPIFSNLLAKTGRVNKLGLFLYSTGGALDTPWPLVSLFREYCKSFEVIIPYKAHSAATLISLGADKIVMTPLSFLSPIDPQGNFKVGDSNRQLQVEDISAYIDFAKSKIGLAEQTALVQILNNLSSETSPSILGSINRTHSLIRLIAGKMLKTHKNKLEEHQINQIIENLTEKLFSHQHLINRREAKEVVGFRNIIDLANEKEEKLIDGIYKEYSKMLKLSEPFNPDALLGAESSKEIEEDRAIITNSKGEAIYKSKYKISRIQGQPAQRPFDIQVNNLGWVEKEF